MIDSLRTGLPAVVPTTTEGTAPTAETPAAVTPAVQDAYATAPVEAPVVNLSGESDPPAPTPELPGWLQGIVPLPGQRLSHLEDGWTPQGQAYDAQNDDVLTTYYKDHEVILSFQDRTSDTELHVQLGGEDGAPGPTHGGGVAMEGDFVYVADTDGIYVYSREALITAAENGTEAEAIDMMPVPPDVLDPIFGTGLASNGSFMTVKDGQAFIGTYAKSSDGQVGAVWRYDIDPQTGMLIEDSRSGPIIAPERAQGMMVVDGGLIFTTGKKELIYQPYDDGTFTADADQRVDISNGRLDSWAQGISVIDGELWVTYESGSELYDGEEGRQFIQRIPLEDLDLEAAGLTPEDFAG